MITSPIVFASHCARLVGMLSGSALITVRMSSVECNRLSVPPIAIREVDAKKAVPFCSAAMICMSTMRASRCSMRRIQISR